MNGQKNGQKNNQKNIRWVTLGIVLAAMALLVSACNQESSSTSQHPASMVWMYTVSEEDGSYGELYKQSLEGNRERVAQQAQWGSQLPTRAGDQVLYLNEKHVLFLQNKAQEQVEIAESVWQYAFSQDESTIYYLTVDGGLYHNPIGGERVKLASAVLAFSVSAEGERIFYLADHDRLYEWQGQNKRMIASGVTSFASSLDGSRLAYLSGDDRLYMVNEQMEISKLSQGEVDAFMLAEDGGTIAYLENYNHDKMLGELYMATTNGEERTKVASDVTTYILSADGQRLIYKQDDRLFFYALKSDLNEQAGGAEAESFYFEGETLVYADKAANLYLAPWGKEAERIASEVTWFTLLASGQIYFRTKEDRLFRRLPGESENKLLAEAYQDFVVDESGLYLVTEDDKLELHTLAEQPKVLLDQVRDYARIYNHAGWQVYRKIARLSDMAGYWSAYPEGDTFIEIKELDDSGSRFSITTYRGSSVFTSEFEIGYTGESAIDFAGETNEGTLILRTDGTLTISADVEDTFIRMTKAQASEALRQADAGE